MGFPSAIGDECWSGLKFSAFSTKEEKSGSTLRKNLIILKRSDSLLDFAVFESVFVSYREKVRKYGFEITSVPLALRDETIIVHLTSYIDIKLTTVENIERFSE